MLIVVAVGSLVASDPVREGNSAPVRRDAGEVASGEVERRSTTVTAEEIRDALLNAAEKLVDLKIVVVEKGNFSQRTPGMEVPVTFKEVWLHESSSQSYIDWRSEGHGDEWWTGFKPLEELITAEDLVTLPGLKQCADLARVPSFADSRLLRKQAPDGSKLTLHSLCKTPKFVSNLFVPLIEFNKPWIAPERLAGAPLADLIARLPLTHWRILGEEKLGEEEVVVAAIRLQDTIEFPLKRHGGKLSLTPTYLVWFSKRFGWMPLRIEHSVQYGFEGHEYWMERRSDGKQPLVYEATDFMPVNDVWVPRSGKQASYMQESEKEFGGFDELVDTLQTNRKLPIPGEMRLGYEYEWKILSLEKIDPTLNLWFEPQDGAEVYNMDTHKRYVQGDAVASAAFAAREHAIERMVGKPAPEFPEGATWLNGPPLTLKALRGKVVVLDFWTDWCGPCRNDLPKMKALYDQRETNGLIVIGVHLAGSKLPDIQKVMDKFQLEYPICIDVATKDDPNHESLFPSQYSTSFGVGGIPHCVVIDPHGVVAASISNRFDDAIEIATELSKSAK
ncbi:TlpA family protein disulfide reductase [Schlesneria paludicola]|uniref:TlpA family protein disulfide reductase n=1 Tax=Schlesneria paludicola TaxID=360056 RepID=UPI00029A8CC4|nr:TlpA disulfide reductase family protein [Schlesneria paludicola]